MFLLLGRDWNTQEVELTLQTSGGITARKKKMTFFL